MEYPTTGRRRQRSGAVSVAELVERSSPVDEPKVIERRPAADEPTRHAAPPATTILAADAPPEAEAGPERGSSTFAKVCRTAGLAIGMLTVATAVTAAWAINQNSPQHPVAAPQPRYEITGVDALRPDALAAHLGDHRTVQPKQPSAGEPKPTASDGQADLDRAPAANPRQQVPTQDAGTAAGRTTSAGAAPDAESPATLVRRFYQLLANEPDQAASLLKPSLLGSDRASFIEAWSQLRQLRVEQVTDRPDGTVTAVIRMLEPDGTWLRVRQLFSTTDGELPLIGDVRLLSAQRG